MSEYNMSHTGAELDEAIEKVLRGYILPSGNTEITANGEYDVMGFAKALVNVPVPDEYIKLSDLIVHATQQASGTYTGMGATLNNVTIACGFKPKIFSIWCDGAVLSKDSSSPYNMTSAVTICDNQYDVLFGMTSFILLGSASQAQGGRSNTWFVPTETGVQHSQSSMNFSSGTSYKWYALG